MNDFRTRIDKQWDIRTAKMDWLGLEQILRDILNSNFDSQTKVELSKEAIAAYTKRG